MSHGMWVLGTEITVSVVSLKPCLNRIPFPPSKRYIFSSSFVFHWPRGTILLSFKQHLSDTTQLYSPWVAGELTDLGILGETISARCSKTPAQDSSQIRVTIRYLPQQCRKTGLEAF